MTIGGLAVRKDSEALLIVPAQPLRVLSSAAHGDGLAPARAVPACACFRGLAGELGRSMPQAARRILHAGINGWQERNG